MSASNSGARNRAESDDDDLIVEADADKLFFISMLIKDIELIPAVLDLVDNSVDSAESIRRSLEAVPGDLGAKPFKDLKVALTVTRDGFSITDNCAGIDLDVARHYAFRFGRPEEYEGVPGSIGEFGVGMKRALFKLGKVFTVESRTDHTSFALKVDVDAWADDDSPDWTFKLDSAKRNLRPPSPREKRGTTVSVTTLHPSVATDFANSQVIGQLREQLRLRHQGAIQLGLEITLNNEKLSGLVPRLLSGRDFSPMNHTFSVDTEAGSVFVRLFAGIAKSDRKSDDVLDDGQAEAFRGAGDAGWWVFCNNRLLLYADRTELTGWGSAAAAYHPQYRQFRGYAFLSSDNTSLLPWNTTKTYVDQDSPVWRAVRSHIMAALADVQAVINRLKSERSRADEPGQAPISRALSSADSLALNEIPPSPVITVPAIPKRSAAPRRTEQKMQFSVPRSEYEQVAEAIGSSNVSEVGRQIFRYFYEREIES